MSVIDLINCSLINSYFLSKTSKFLKLWKYLKALKLKRPKNSKNY